MPASLPLDPGARRAAVQAVTWISKPTVTLDEGPSAISRGFTQWAVGGALNVCFNALDRHVIAGRADQSALVYYPADGDGRRSYSYAHLLDEVARCAGAFRALGVSAGERVLVFAPLMPQTVIAMLACARIGAVLAVADEASSSARLAALIDAVHPRVIVSASCRCTGEQAVELKPVLDAALESATHAPDQVVLIQRPQVRAAAVDGRDLDWGLLMRPGTLPPAECVTTAATDPLFLLDGQVPRCSGESAVALTWAVHSVVGLRPGEVMLTTGDAGWVASHWTAVFGPLLVGGTSVVVEGSPRWPRVADTLGGLLVDHQVAVLVTARSAIGVLLSADSSHHGGAEAPVSRLRTVVLAGESPGSADAAAAVVDGAPGGHDDLAAQVRDLLAVEVVDANVVFDWPWDG